jgi:hypothetical protein
MKAMGKCTPTGLGISFACVLALLAILGASPAKAAVITTYHYNNARTGWPADR